MNNNQELRNKAKQNGAKIIINFFINIKKLYKGESAICRWIHI